MFTGIIEEVGTIQAVAKGSKSAILTIAADKVLEGSKVGDSIAVNGVCLTVTTIAGRQFTADVMAETLRRSSLGSLSRGSNVNLERAMAADGRFGGHIVSGHIDGTGTIVSLTPEDNAVWVRIQTTGEVLKYIVQKGSIAIDGISLTVADVTETNFAVSVIPHTGAETTLLTKKAGDIVNLENDIIGKYVDKLMHFQTGEETQEAVKHTGITKEFLLENGF
jgi:riboflavin synthase